MKEIDETLKDILSRVAGMMLRDIRKNIPKPGYRAIRPGEKGPTGDLLRSLKVKVDSAGDAIEVTFKDYGKYTAFGTTPAYRDTIAEKDTFFGIAVPRAYQRGTKGIRPQYWLSLRDQQDKYEDFIEKNLQIGLNEFIENYLYDRI